MSENCAAFIDLLIEYRHNKGMTQKELAEAACLTQSVIARLESKRATPQLDTILKIASALGCDLTVVPVKISGDVPKQETRQAMAEVDEMIKSGAGKKFDSVDSLFEELDS